MQPGLAPPAPDAAQHTRRGISPVFMVLLTAVVTAGVLVWQTPTVSFLTTNATLSVPVIANRLLAFIVVFGGWIVALCLHEFAHAVLAWRFGDHGVVERGYLTLNPLKYANPIVSIVIPVIFMVTGGIGFPGGAVWLHPDRMRARWQRSLVALAGPFTSLAVGVLLLIVLRIGLWIDDSPSTGVARYGHPVLWGLLAFLATMQIAAAVLNLVPIPGLDGFGALEPYLSEKMRQRLLPFSVTGFFVLLFLLLLPPVNRVFWGCVDGIFQLSGVPAELSTLGRVIIRFWTGN